MDHTSACRRAKELVDFASEREPSIHVDDATWNDLIKLGVWAKEHGINPQMVENSIPKPSDQRTWLIVKHSAQAVRDALGCAERART
jgi:hypothetical protein